MNKTNNKLSSVGVVVRQFRQRRNLTLEDVAFEMGVTKAYIGFLETGSRYPSIGTLVRLAEAMKVPPGELLDAIVEREKLMKAKTGLDDDQEA